MFIVIPLCVWVMQARTAAFVVWEVVAVASAATDADLFRLAVAVDAVLR